MTKRLPPLALAIALLSMPVASQGDEGRSSWSETLVVSITVGSVLGASTLPFYEQPGKQLKNIAFGASVGAVVGLGIIISGLFLGSEEEEYAENFRRDFSDEYHHRRDPNKLSPHPYTSVYSNVETASAYTPLYSLRW